MKKRITATAALIAALGSMVGASTAEQAQNDLREGMRPVALDGGSVMPVSGENHLNASFLARESFDQRVHIPHPPIDEIPEMPMPEPVAPGVTPMHLNPSTVTFHDALTGETYEKALPFHTGAESGVSAEPEYHGYNNLIDTSIENSRSFGNMSITGGLTTLPQSYNVKLVMRFTDTGGVQRWFVCSGSMQDPGVVLSAAHCVYARTPNGLTINDWADIVYVYPAWDGDSNNGQFSAPDGDEVIQNFGYAFGTSFIAGTNYINNGDFDADIGCIRLSRGSSRNVGALTGYYAWAWGFSCGDIQSRSYNNFSYPTENCPTPGLHTGLDMYYWNGTIDSCPGNQLQLNTGGNCLDTVWGGMSGSAMYYIDDGTRRAHAVCSNSNRTTSGRYAKLWETFTNDMVDFENNTRGNTLDIEPMRFRPRGSSTVLQGQAMDDSFDVTMVNAT
ncbi:MAG: hypothetical protein HRU11_15165, partial [Parvularculaceae bacterium]|nr:hypothetical protein [Parvularculaceae bacterium]